MLSYFDICFVQNSKWIILLEKTIKDEVQLPDHVRARQKLKDVKGVTEGIVLILPDRCKQPLSRKAVQVHDHSHDKELLPHFKSEPLPPPAGSFVLKINYIPYIPFPGFIRYFL